MNIGDNEQRENNLHERNNTINELFIKYVKNNFSEEDTKVLERVFNGTGPTYSLDELIKNLSPQAQLDSGIVFFVSCKKENEALVDELRARREREKVKIISKTGRETNFSFKKLFALKGVKK